MSYITQRKQRGGFILRNNYEFVGSLVGCRIKRISSCEDSRAWNICGYVRSAYLLDSVNAYPPYDSDGYSAKGKIKNLARNICTGDCNDGDGNNARRETAESCVQNEGAKIFIGTSKQLESQLSISKQENSCLCKLIKEYKEELNKCQTLLENYRVCVESSVPTKLKNLEQELSSSLSQKEKIDLYKRQIQLFKEYCKPIQLLKEETKSLANQLKASQASDRSASAISKSILNSSTEVPVNMDNLQKVISELRSTVISLQPIKKERDLLRNEIRRLNFKLRQIDENYSGEISCLRKRSSILDEILNERNELLLRLKKYDNVEETIRKLQIKVKEADVLRDQRDSLFKELNLTKSECTDFHFELGNMSFEISLLSSSMESISSERDKLLEKIQNCQYIESELEKLRTSCNEQSRSLRSYEGERDMYKLKYENLHKQMLTREAHFKKQINVAENTISVQNSRIFKLMIKLSQLFAEKDKYKKCVSNMKTKLSSASDEIVRFTDKIHKLSYLKNQATAIRNDFETTLNYVKKSNDVVVTQLNEKCTKLKEKMKQMPQLEKVIDIVVTEENRDILPVHQRVRKLINSLPKNENKISSTKSSCFMHEKYGLKYAKAIRDTNDAITDIIQQIKKVCSTVNIINTCNYLHKPIIGGSTSEEQAKIPINENDIFSKLINICTRAEIIAELFRKEYPSKTTNKEVDELLRQIKILYDEKICMKSKIRNLSNNLISKEVQDEIHNLVRMAESVKGQLPSLENCNEVNFLLNQIIDSNKKIVELENDVDILKNNRNGKWLEPSKSTDEISSTSTNKNENNTIAIAPRKGSSSDKLNDNPSMESAKSSPNKPNIISSINNNDVVKICPVVKDLVNLLSKSQKRISDLKAQISRCQQRNTSNITRSLPALNKYCKEKVVNSINGKDSESTRSNLTKNANGPDTLTTEIEPYRKDKSVNNYFYSSDENSDLIEGPPVECAGLDKKNQETEDIKRENSVDTIVVDDHSTIDRNRIQNTDLCNFSEYVEETPKYLATVKEHVQNFENARNRTAGSTPRPKHEEAEHSVNYSITNNLNEALPALTNNPTETNVQMLYIVNMGTSYYLNKEAPDTQTYTPPKTTSKLSSHLSTTNESEVAIEDAIDIEKNRIRPTKTYFDVNNLKNQLLEASKKVADLRTEIENSRKVTATYKQEKTERNILLDVKAADGKMNNPEDKLENSVINYSLLENQTTNSFVENRIYLKTQDQKQKIENQGRGEAAVQKPTDEKEFVKKDIFDFSEKAKTIQIECDKYGKPNITSPMVPIGYLKSPKCDTEELIRERRHRSHFCNSINKVKLTNRASICPNYPICSDERPERKTNTRKKELVNENLKTLILQELRELHINNKQTFPSRVKSGIHFRNNSFTRLTCKYFPKRPLSEKQRRIKQERCSRRVKSARNRVLPNIERLALKTEEANETKLASHQAKQECDTSVLREMREIPTMKKKLFCKKIAERHCCISVDPRILKSESSNFKCGKKHEKGIESIKPTKNVKQTNKRTSTCYTEPWKKLPMPIESKYGQHKSAF